MKNANAWVVLRKALARSGVVRSRTVQPSFR
jgi:hypothetical protein